MRDKTDCCRLCRTRHATRKLEKPRHVRPYPESRGQVLSLLLVLVVLNSEHSHDTMSVLARNYSKHVSSILKDRAILTPSAFLYGQRRCYASAQKQKSPNEQNSTSPTPARKPSAKNAKPTLPKEDDITLEKRLEIIDFLKVNAHTLPYDPFAQANANYGNTNGLSNISSLY